MIDRIDTALWQHYKQAAAARRRSFDKFEGGEITSDEFFEQLHSNMLYELCELCAKSYCEKLTQLPEDERVTLYFEDTKEAAGVDDLEMLLVLDAVPGEAQLIVPVELDEFLLSYYVAFFKRTIDKHEISTSQMLFERILDTSESGLDIYTWVIDEIFSMDKGPEWYALFFHGVHKLLVRAPVNQLTLQAMKKGLTGTSKDIKEEIEGIIAYTYENRREISVLDIYRDGANMIALMQFQDGTKPEIGMELNNDEVTCRIEDFVQRNEFSQLYNCLVIIIKGKLTMESCFEIQI